MSPLGIASLPAHPPACLQLVMFHGCQRDASAGWPYDPLVCSECHGLPEEVARTKQALRMGFAVLAVESRNRAEPRCFSSSTDAKTSDLLIAPNIIQVGRLTLPAHARLCSGSGLVHP